VTLAPELPGSLALISHLRETHPALVISLGHSTADFATGLAALSCGADALTHVFNAMPPLHHREPGLAGLMMGGSNSGNGVGGNGFRPYYSVIADGIHLHPSVLRMAFRADPVRCILITDSTELAGLPDGVYPGNGQIAYRQRKVGNRVTLIKDEEEREREKKPDLHFRRDDDDAAAAAAPAGEEEKVLKESTAAATAEDEILIGSCCTLDHCVRNMVSMAGCTLAEAVRCVTENVAAMMGEGKRGVLEPGRRADFVLLDNYNQNQSDVKDEGGGWVRETWIEGVRVYKREVGGGSG
jgi:N-acetylglucosamine-6-phosphate deacetylase